MRLTKATVAKLALPPGKAEALIFDDALPGFGVRLRAGGSRKWVAQFKIGDKQRRMTLGSVEAVDPDEARKRAKEALGKVALGVDPQAEKVTAREAAAVTLSAVVPRYLAYAEPRQRAAYHQDVARYLRTHWAPLGEVPLDRITRPTVSARLGEIARERGAHSATRARAALSALYGWALGEGLCAANPTADTHRPAETVSRDRVLDDGELRLVWLHAGEGDFGRIVRLLVLLGARREEIGGARWSELQGDVLSIGTDRSKNGKPFDLPLCPAALALIAGTPRRGDRELIFGSREGPFSGWSKSKADLDARMAAALRAERGGKAELTPWRLHDLRRTAATRMGDIGVQPHIVEAILNHQSGTKAGVAGIYNRSQYSAEKRAGLALWADRVAELVK